MHEDRNLIEIIRRNKLFGEKKKWDCVCELLEKQEQRMKLLEEKQEQRMELWEENLRNNNALLYDMQQLIGDLQKNLEGNNRFIQHHSLIHQSLEENLRNNNFSIENLQYDTNKIEELTMKINECSQYCVKLKCNLDNISNRLNKERNLETDLKCTSDNVEEMDIRPESTENKYENIDYFDFENHFRGSQESIKKNQTQYLKYFENKHNVIDLGCGRGEFLELLKEQGIGSIGVDFYPEFVEYCKMHNLNAICSDAIAYLERIETVDGIFAGQLVEHLSSGQIMALCRLAYEKLEDGSYLVLETPNPTSLAIFSHAFYIDPSHIKPVHPLTMQYYLEKAGFKTIEIIYTENSKLPVQIPQLQIEGNVDIEGFNSCMKEVEQALFGSQDYAIVAKK